MADAALVAELASINAKLTSGMSGYTLPTGLSVSFDLAALQARKTQLENLINNQNSVSRRSYAVARRPST